MYIEFESLDDLIMISKKYRALKIFYVYEGEFATRIEAIAQTTKNTYSYTTIIGDKDTLEKIIETLLDNDFVKVATVKTWEG